MRRRFRVAHQVAPGTAKLSVNITIWRHSILDERPDQRINAVIGAPAFESAFGNAGYKTRMIDQESNVRETLGDNADVGAFAVFVGLFTERQALVYADNLDAE